MAVFVWSRAHKRLPFFSLPRKVSVSSRVRRAVRSSSMYRSPVTQLSVLMWLRSVFWVSSR
jgi:hypothetical protein